ncbi:hypothetical protein ACH4Y0_02100 [Streptomyces sp. NPDC020707]|uniref:hypothetical protein n=1 Tax=Streptomyces sp. NPDC020707 TaxID=3365084 RepID=UPI0037B32381
MGLKKDIQETPQGQVIMLAFELIGLAKEFSFEKQQDGGIQAGFVLDLAPDRSYRVKIKKSASGKFGLEVDPAKVASGRTSRKH